MVKSTHVPTFRPSIHRVSGYKFRQSPAASTHVGQLTDVGFDQHQAFAPITLATLGLSHQMFIRSIPEHASFGPADGLTQALIEPNRATVNSPANHSVSASHAVVPDHASNTGSLIITTISSDSATPAVPTQSTHDASGSSSAVIVSAVASADSVGAPASPLGAGTAVLPNDASSSSGTVAGTACQSSALTAETDASTTSNTPAANSTIANGGSTTASDASTSSIHYVSSNLFLEAMKCWGQMVSINEAVTAITNQVTAQLNTQQEYLQNIGAPASMVTGADSPSSIAGAIASNPLNHLFS